MTRIEAIAIITATLPMLDDASVTDLAHIVQASTFVLRDLTDEERAGIERSKEDFKVGRTYSIAEARTMTDDFLKTLRAKYPTAP